MTDRVCELFCGAGGMGLGFTAGFLLGVVTTALGMLWLMTMAVVA